MFHSILTFFSTDLLGTFYLLFIGLAMKDKNNLNNIVKVCLKTNGVIQRADEIINHPVHVLTLEFCLMPSGQSYFAPLTKTNAIFFSSAIRLLNALDTQY